MRGAAGRTLCLCGPCCCTHWKYRARKAEHMPRKNEEETFFCGQGVPCVCKGVREVPPEGILEQSRLHKTAGFAPAQTPCPESAQRRLRFLQGSARASDSPPVRQRRYPQFQSGARRCADRQNGTRGHRHCGHTHSACFPAQGNSLSPQRPLSPEPAGRPAARAHPHRKAGRAAARPGR